MSIALAVRSRSSVLALPYVDFPIVAGSAKLT
jgi:hypothetical protein